MALSDDIIVELEGVNGEWFNLTTGDRGIYLDTDPKGFYDPPVKVVYEEPGNFPGARYLNDRILRRDIVFGVVILNDYVGENSWISRDSEWRKAWSFKEDCKLHITTPWSGHRYLHLRLGESPEVGMFVAPTGRELNTAIMTCIAGDPFWYQDDEVYHAETKTDTTFEPSLLPWPWPQAQIPAETLYINVDPSDGRGGLNPTDQDIYLKWAVPASELPPSQPYIPGLPWLGAPTSPATIWTIPDYSFTDPAQANRRLRLPSLIGGLLTNQVQRINVRGTPTGGTFVCTLDTFTTGPIAWTGGASALQTALEALPNVGDGGVSVTKGILYSDPYVITFEGGNSGQELPVLYVESSLVGLNNPTLQATAPNTGSTAPAENCTIDVDPRFEQIVSESGSQVWSRMNGVRFRNPVPAWTKSKRFEITASGCVPGQIVTLRIPRPWSRPWGLE